jgi:hypothetical protein
MCAYLQSKKEVQRLNLFNLKYNIKSKGPSPSISLPQLPQETYPEKILFWRLLKEEILSLVSASELTRGYRPPPRETAPPTTIP